MSPRNQSTTDLDATSRSSSMWISELSCLQVRVSLEEAFARDFRELNSQNEYSTERYLERTPSSCRGTSRSRFRVSEPRARRRGGVPTPNDAEAARRTSENRWGRPPPPTPAPSGSSTRDSSCARTGAGLLVHVYGVSRTYPSARSRK